MNGSLQALGGLAGLPFAGKSGFRAYLHHVPARGEAALILRVLAPVLSVRIPVLTAQVPDEGKPTETKPEELEKLK